MAHTLQLHAVIMASATSTSMDARYQDPSTARFLSEDPNFLVAGAPDWVTGMKGDLSYLGLRGFVNSSKMNYLANR
jgi:hypothetical protein